LRTSATGFAKTLLDNERTASVWIYQTLAADQVSRFRCRLIAKRVSSTAEGIVHRSACISSATEGIGPSIPSATEWIGPSIAAATEWIGSSPCAAKWITARCWRGSGRRRVIGKGIGHRSFKRVVGGDFRFASG
jgi:hypothetical protein